MQAKFLLGSAMIAGLMSIGALAGSVIGNGSASAQTAVAIPTATATAPGTNDPNVPGNPPAEFPGGRGGPRGHGPGDGGERLGMGATADGASQAITNTTDLISLVKSDLAYATSKMDTAEVQKWLDRADALLVSAQNGNSGSQYGQAVVYAQAARELAMAADSLMAQKLGADNLPSYSQLLQRPDKGNATTTVLTQAQASRMLAESYNRLVGLSAQVKAASNAAEATPYLTDAQNAYKAAYDAYQAGSYNNAATSVRLAEKLAHVVEAVVRASTAPANADTVVTVPAPNF